MIIEGTPVSTILTQASIGFNWNVWGVDASHNIYQYQSSNGTHWTQTQIPGGLSQVSVAADGTVWGVNPAGNIFRYLGNNTWTQMPGNNKDGQLSTNTGPFVQVVAASSGVIWGLDPTGLIDQYTPSNTTDPWQWTNVAAAKSISGASDGSFVYIDMGGTTNFVQLQGEAL